MRFPRQILLGFLLGWVGAQARLAGADLWNSGYYAGWTQEDLPASAIDFTALTHVIHFSLLPKADGNIDGNSFNLSPTKSQDLISKAHAAGVRVLVCVGGAGTQAEFRGATQPAKVAAFIERLVTFATTRGYDGVDVDWEPLDAADEAQYRSLILGLRTALTKAKPGLLLTAAVAEQPALFNSLQEQFDQINLMAYDLAGPYPGWVTWFNAPLFDGGFRFPSTGGLIPSADGLVNRFINAGLKPAKLGLGVPFYGLIWKGGAGLPSGGATAPRQGWTTAPQVTAVAFREVMSTYFSAARFRWDSNAFSPYLTFDNAGSTADQFICYDDERSCRGKVSYARNRGLGGLMIWELSQDYRPSLPLAQRHPLLSALKESLQPPRFTAVKRLDGEIQLTFQTMPLARYAVQWSPRLVGGTWTTLTNRAGDGEVITIKDPFSRDGQARYYRLKTPP